MAFGIDRAELKKWKREVTSGKIAYLTHYWLHPRFSGVKTVTKVGCSDLNRLQVWCVENGLDPKHIHHRDDYPHYDLIGGKQKEILVREQLWEHIRRFGI